MAEQVAILFADGTYTTVVDSYLVKLEWRWHARERAPADPRARLAMLGGRLRLSNRQIVFELPPHSSLFQGGHEQTYARYAGPGLAQATTVRLTVQTLSEDVVLRNHATTAIALSRQQFEDEVTSAVDQMLGDD